jgi:hypothetical protein
MQQKRQLLAENQTLTPESRCPRCNTRNLRSVIMTVNTDRTVRVDFTCSPDKANNLSCNECLWLNYDFARQKLFFSTNMPQTVKIGGRALDEKRERTDRLKDDFDSHFDSKTGHYQNGKLAQFDKNCSFCEAYSNTEKDSNLDSHQSYKKNTGLKYNE